MLRRLWHLKGGLGIATGKFPHQVHVVRVYDLPIVAGQRQNGTLILRGGGGAEKARNKMDLKTL